MSDATALRDQLTTALEEAKWQDDPFDQWWASLKDDGYYLPDYHRVGSVMMHKGNARIIWDAAVATMKEGK